MARLKGKDWCEGQRAGKEQVSVPRLRNIAECYAMLRVS